jgi:hypothetical protein
VMLDEPRDVGVVLKHKHGLAQAEGSFLGRRTGVARSALSLNGGGQTECKSCVNSGGKEEDHFPDAMIQNYNFRGGFWQVLASGLCSLRGFLGVILRGVVPRFPGFR